MYTPPAFAADEPALLAALALDNPLASLVSQGAEGLVATHLPLLYQADRGRLIGHVARANRQWHDLDGREGLAIFLGRQGYVSPSWYASKQEHGRVVPTWNYEAVHVYGRLSVLQEPRDLLEIVDALTQSQESGRAAPWAISDAPESFIAAQLKGIVGLELAVTRIEGKRKFSQNRPEADRLGVIRGLRADAHDQANRLAEAMEQDERERDS